MMILLEISQTTTATEQRPQLAPPSHCPRGCSFGLTSRRSNLFIAWQDPQYGFMADLLRWRLNAAVLVYA
jgi:hypothetical protein